MNKLQGRQFKTIVDSRTFLRKNRFDCDPFARVAAVLDDVIERVRVLDAATQRATLTSNAATMKKYCDELRRGHMIPIARRGKLLFHGEAKIQRVLRVPHARATPAAILAAARVMAKAVEPHRRLFVQEGLPKTFLAELRASAARLRAFVTANEQSRAASPAAYRELREQIARGRSQIDIVDGQLLGWLDAQPPARRKTLAAMWRAAHRIPARTGRPRRRPKGDPDTSRRPQSEA